MLCTLKDYHMIHMEYAYAFRESNLNSATRERPVRGGTLRSLARRERRGDGEDGSGWNLLSCPPGKQRDE